MSWWDAAYRRGVVNWDPGEYDRHLPRVIREFGITPGRALDLGCGTGKSALWLAEKGFDVTGIDLSPAAIQQARQSARVREIEARFLVGRFPDDFALPFVEQMRHSGTSSVASKKKLGLYDLIIDRASIQHMGDSERETIVRTVTSLLTPGGLIYSLIIAGFGVPRSWGMGTWTERSIRSLFGTSLSLLHVEQTVFTPGEPGPVLAWLVVAQKR